MNLVYVGIKPWHYPLKQRPHFLIEAMVQHGWRCLYIDPLFYSYTHEYVENPPNEGTFSQISDSLYVYTPNLLNKGNIYEPTKCQVNYEYNIPIVQEWLKANSFDDLILIVTQPLDTFIINKLNEVINIYDYMDAYEEYFPVIRELSDKILKDCNIVMCVSEFLHDYARTLNSKTFVLNDGANLGIPMKPLPSDFTTVGYIGAINARIDIPLLETMMNTLKGAHLNMVGPIQTDLGSLPEMKNVTFTGFMSYESMLQKLVGFHIGIIPFKINRLTKSTDPVKAYDYLSLGIPIVATDIPSLHRFEGNCYIARSHSDFISLVSSSLSKEVLPREIEQRRLFAQENSWTQRSLQLQEVIHRELSLV